MKFILVLSCIFSVAISAPQTKVKIDVHSSQGGNIMVHHTRQAEKANVQVSHKQERGENDEIVRNTNIKVTNDDQEEKHTEIRVSGVRYPVNFHSTTSIRGGSRTGNIAFTLPSYISGNINLY